MRSGNSGVVIGAVLVFAAGYFLLFSPNEGAFRRISAGDTEESVISAMGRPQKIERRAPKLKDADYEFEYYLWPLPKKWCVGFKSDHVVGTGVFP
jgi:hypothetical protein